MIEELPDLPLRLILSFLSYTDQFSLTRTCKKLKCLIDGQVQRNLFVFLDCYPCHQYLFQTDELVYYTDSCRLITDFNRFISSQHRENLKLLQKPLICFEGLYTINNYPEKIEIDLKNFKEKNYFLETWRLKIHLENLNFFEKIEHLEIKGVGKVIGQLSLKNLKIFAVETRRLSEFNLQCGQLKAMRISSAARPKFVDAPHDLDYLSTGLLISKGTGYYLLGLYRQCPRLSTIGFEYPGLLGFTLQSLNDNLISLPLWRVIKMERPQYVAALNDKLFDYLTMYDKSIEPDNMQICLNDKLISLERLISITQLLEPSNSCDKLVYSLGILKKKPNPNLNDLVSLLSGTNTLVVGDGDEIADYINPIDPSDYELMMKLKCLKTLYIFSNDLAGFIRLDEKLFQRMLTTFTKLEEFLIESSIECGLGQDWLSQTPNHWPNPHSIMLYEKCESIRFVAKFKNLRRLRVRFNLPREETRFLMQTCPSLYFIGFYNQTNDFLTILGLNERWRKNRKKIKVLGKNLHFFYVPLNYFLSDFILDHHKVSDYENSLHANSRSLQTLF